MQAGRPLATATAPGKAILLGEHAVVYGKPAIAVPISSRRATATVRARPPGGGVILEAVDLGRRYPGRGPCVDEHGCFLQSVLQGILEELGLAVLDVDLEITIRSDIPVARGMGSGAAVSAAVMRAVGRALGHEPSLARLSELVFATEQLLHGTPSGIDNTTVVFEEPVWFQRGLPPEVCVLGCPVTLVIGDSGIPAHTRQSVEMVRSRREEAPEAINACFEAIEEIVCAGREALAEGDLETLGGLMNANQGILAQIGVSSPELDRLILAAREGGALGAKLSGGGMGGCMIALVRDEQVRTVSEALLAAGAESVIHSRLSEAKPRSPDGEHPEASTNATLGR